MSLTPPRPPIGGEDEIVDLGAAEGHLSARAAEIARSVVAVDRPGPSQAGRAESLNVELNGDLRAPFGDRRFTRALVLNVIEHPHSPEQAVERTASLLLPGGTLIASTANIGFFIPRLMLLTRNFNYGERSIVENGSGTA